MNQSHEDDRKMAYDAHELGIKLRERAVINGERVTISLEDFKQVIVALPLMAGWILAKARTAEEGER
jgi:hypothetical protein